MGSWAYLFLLVRAGYVLWVALLSPVKSTLYPPPALRVTLTSVSIIYLSSSFVSRNVGHSHLYGVINGGTSPGETADLLSRPDVSVPQLGPGQGAVVGELHLPGVIVSPGVSLPGVVGFPKSRVTGDRVGLPIPCHHLAGVILSLKGDVGLGFGNLGLFGRPSMSRERVVHQLGVGVFASLRSGRYQPLGIQKGCTQQISQSGNHLSCLHLKLEYLCTVSSNMPRSKSDKSKEGKIRRPSKPEYQRIRG